MKPSGFLLPAVLFTLSMPCSYGQMGLGKPEDVKDLKYRPLIVMLKEAKSDQEKPYVEYYNQAIQRAVRNFWIFNDSIVFMPRSQVQSLHKSGNTSYGVMQFALWEVREYKSDKWSKNSFMHRYQSDSWIRTILAVGLIEKAFQRALPYIYYNHLPNIYPSEGDLVCAMQQIQSYLQYRLEGKKARDMREEIEQNAYKLKEKTLLMDKEEVSKKLTDADIKAAYPYPYKLAGYEEIEKAILSRDPKYAYVQIVPMAMNEKTVYAHLVVNAENGEMLGWSAPGPIMISGTGYGQRIKSNHLKDYASNIEK